MITDEEIRRVVNQAAPNALVWLDGAELEWSDIRAIYQLGRQRQRESDAALCRDAAEKYMERAKNSNTHLRASAALASNAAATCLETAIRANTGELK